MNTLIARKSTALRTAAVCGRPALLTVSIAIGGLFSGAASAQEPYGADALRAMAVEAVEQQLPEADIARGANRTEVEAGAIDTRLRLIGKWNAKSYGDKLGVEHSGGVTINVIDTFADTE